MGAVGASAPVGAIERDAVAAAASGGRSAQGCGRLSRAAAAPAAIKRLAPAAAVGRCRAPHRGRTRGLWARRGEACFGAEEADVGGGPRCDGGVTGGECSVTYLVLVLHAADQRLEHLRQGITRESGVRHEAGHGPAAASSQVQV